MEFNRWIFREKPTVRVDEIWPRSVIEQRWHGGNRRGGEQALKE